MNRQPSVDCNRRKKHAPAAQGWKGKDAPAAQGWKGKEKCSGSTRMSQAKENAAAAQGCQRQGENDGEAAALLWRAQVSVYRSSPSTVVWVAQ
jgi:hypothetical protein